jgi:hypothetical protein
MLGGCPTRCVGFAAERLAEGATRGRQLRRPYLSSRSGSLGCICCCCCCWAVFFPPRQRQGNQRRACEGTWRLRDRCWAQQPSASIARLSPDSFLLRASHNSQTLPSSFPSIPSRAHLCKTDHSQIEKDHIGIKGTSTRSAWTKSQDTAPCSGLRLFLCSCFVGQSSGP